MQLSETIAGIAIHVSRPEAKALLEDLGGFTSKTGDELHHSLSAILFPLQYQHDDATGHSGNGPH